MKLDWLWARLSTFNAMVDSELIVPFQTYVYYPVIVLMTGYSAFGADMPPQVIEQNLAGWYYWGWLALGMVFPPMAMFGRWLYENALKHDSRNGGYGGALLMFFGDFGAWSAVVVYIVCTADTFWWGQALWASGFVLLAAHTSSMFTYRSLRRLVQIERRSRRARH